MTSANPTTIKFKVQDFKRLVTPLDHHGFRDFLCVVDIQDLPDLSEFGKSNLRDPKDRGSVPTKIRTSLVEEDLFVYLNRGLVIVADSVDFNNKSNMVEITFSIPDVHGLIDGGHTHLIISQEKEAIAKQSTEGGEPISRHVKVEILQGFDLEQIKEIAGARNTSNQVKDESLLNIAGRFKKLQESINDLSYYNDIAFKEFETYPDHSPKPIDIRDIISILYMFDIESFGASKHPINGYRSKIACLKEFKNKTDNGKTSVYDKLYSILPDLLRLYDEIHYELPDLYNKSRKEFGEGVSRGAFGSLKGVMTRNKNDIALLFSGKKTNYRVPTGFIYPMLGSFRGLVEERGGRFQWVKGCNPFKLLCGDMGLQMADSIGQVARKDLNPSKTGKDASLWRSCYQAVLIARKDIEIDHLRKQAQ